VEEYSIRIFNRWGQCVFLSVDHGYVWDDTQYGVPAPIGTYMYMVSYKHAISGKEYFAKGSVTLMR